MKTLLRHLPSVHYLQQHQKIVAKQQKDGISFSQLTEWLQVEVNNLRELLLQGKWTSEVATKESFATFIIDNVLKRHEAFENYNIQPVINATGTILHTNLGRARLSKEAIEQVVKVAENYSNLEYNISEGKRGSRHDHLESLLQSVTGAEAAMVVNNNAAAVYLILRALAKEKEVIVSRGELVEIGGSFRVSAIMEESDAKLKEVGTTNKTHDRDYVDAINEATAMIMKVHTSNFKVVGFTKEVKTKELANIAQSHQIILYEDLGSGVLHDFRDVGIGEEPLVKEAIAEGADLVSFSGDKLLGGPQAGIIVGKKALIDKLKKHQLARVLRVDKMTLAALEATLKQYVLQSVTDIPTVRDLLQSKEEVTKKAKLFIEKLKSSGAAVEVNLEDDTSQVGGGTMPDVALPTSIVELTHVTYSSQALANYLRQQPTPIIVRIKQEKVVLDLRTVTLKEIDIIVTSLTTIN